MPKLNPTLDTTALKNYIMPLLEKIDYSQLLSLLKSKVSLTPDYFMEKTVKELSTIRDKRQRTVNILDYIINAIENFDLSEMTSKVQNISKDTNNFNIEDYTSKLVEILQKLQTPSKN